MAQPTDTRRALTAVTCLVVFVVTCCVASLRAFPGQAQGAPLQAQSAKPAQPQEASSEISSDSQNIIKIHVPVVVVRAVVRDSKGRIIENLKKEDFQIQDAGKPQDINNFAIEHPGARTLKNLEAEPAAARVETGEAKSSAIAVPGRYVALLLDDIHIDTPAALAVRVQTMEVIHSLNRGELVAVYSTSGRLQQGFTSDQEALRQTVARLMPSPMSGATGKTCGQISYYQAQLMMAYHDLDALNTAIEDFWSCKYGKANQAYQAAVADANQTAQGVYNMGDVETDEAVKRISEIVGRLSEMPGDRAIVFVSPGFASMELAGKLSAVLDKAIKANVVLNTVDARGLFVPDAGMDASSSGTCIDRNCSPESTSRFHVQQEQASGEVLASLADGTGGTWFHNRNDLGRGVLEGLSAPSTSYVLGFSPQTKSLDGKFHKIKVTVVGMKDATLQARTGYFAAKPESDPQKFADAQFHDAIFAQEEMNDVPIDVRTKFFVKQTKDASLSVLTHIDASGIHFRKVSGKNCDEMTLGVAIFDERGEFIAGNKRTLTLRLQDETLAKIHTSGMNVKMDFDVKPGTYLVRVVLRESEGAKMAAHNGGVVIPN
jgi:VWFA-related protein